jgi:excisionase family DNA binding protein
MAKAHGEPRPIPSRRTDHVTTPTMATTPDSLTVAEVAREFAVGKHTVYRAIRAGTLRAYALSKHGTRIDRSEVQRVKHSGGVLRRVGG